MSLLTRSSDIAERESARCFLSLDISLSHTKSLKVIRNDTLQYGVSPYQYFDFERHCTLGVVIHALRTGGTAVKSIRDDNKEVLAVTRKHCAAMPPIRSVDIIQFQRKLSHSQHVCVEPPSRLEIFCVRPYSICHGSSV